MDKQVSDPIDIKHFIDGCKVLHGKESISRKDFITKHAQLRDNTMFEELEHVCRYSIPIFFYIIDSSVSKTSTFIHHLYHLKGPIFSKNEKFMSTLSHKFVFESG